MNGACAGNAGGSYLTIMSSGGLQFGILQLVASFGNVWADQAYWQVLNSCPSLFAKFLTLDYLNPGRTSSHAKGTPLWRFPPSG